MWDLSKYSDNTAVIDDRGSTITYRQLQQAGNDLCNAVSKVNGKEARCLVFSMCENAMGSVIGYISFLNGGIVPVMLKHDIDEELLKNLYEEYKPAYIWIPSRDKEKNIYNGLDPVYEKWDYILLKTPFGIQTELNPKLGLLLTTSGSTGSPKFVRQSYNNIRANIDSIVKYLELTSDERPITTLPMNYTYGISIINTHIDVGATLLLTDTTLLQREFWSFFKEQNATSFGGVPYTYEMLKRLRFFKMELPSLKTMTQAGGKLLPELHKEFAEYAKASGRNFVVMYGACEATARMGWLPSERSIEKQGAMGIAIPGGRFELIDADDNVIDEPETVGELVYYGENVTLGYAEKAEDLIKDDERNGRYVTGDMAKKDVDGFYYIIGRKKRFLKIYGNRVNLDDCERMLKAEFGEDLACAGFDDNLYIFDRNENILPDMKRFLAEKTGLNPAAFKTMRLDEIPHNESGKVVYKALEKYYG